MNKFIATVKVKLAQVNKNLRATNELAAKSTALLESRTEEGKLWLVFSANGNSSSIVIPIPYTDENGNQVIGERVVRAVGTWNIDNKRYKYWEFMAWLLTDVIEQLRPEQGKRIQLNRIVQSLYQKDTAFSGRGSQEIINSVINKLPLCGTPLETWAMCQRTSFIDAQFDDLTPDEALAYQVKKNLDFFPWTSIGLSDTSMTNNNLLEVDIRKLTPFGIKHHNPQRNLYQTLGMRGDEKPTILTQSAAKLEERGIGHKGWNWLTCFMDVPANFEDQILVSTRHMDKFTTEDTQIICFGEVQVKEGDQVSEDQIISIEPSGDALRFRRKCDSANIISIRAEKIIFNGSERLVSVIQVETKHVMKEGIKLTNRHGNKGVVAFTDLGTMLDPIRGELPIDVIVSAKTIGKRKNYGQVLEALTTLYYGLGRLVIPDDKQVNIEILQEKLKEKGYTDGACQVKTRWGEHSTLTGWCFWGLIRNPELQLWTEDDVVATDNRGLRRAGSKVGHIEIKALTTMFGDDNAVIQEIISHQQGTDDVRQLLDVLEIMRGKEFDLPVISWQTIKPIVQSTGFFHSLPELTGSIADENLLPGGFILELPQIYHVFIPENGKDVEEALLDSDVANLETIAKAGGTNVFLSQIYVPNSLLRGSWQHQTGLWGLSDIGGHLNNIIKACHDEPDARKSSLFSAIFRYFHHISTRLGSKRGELANLCLAVRYTNSAKATATLAIDDLPLNWIEIHEEMAQTLRVKTGDYVLTERFPCLGFMSLRTQRVRVTADPQCRYVIRVSGNSLVSQNLDFDGDVLFVLSFHSPEARELLEKDFHQPPAARQVYIEASMERKKPITQTISLSTANLEAFPTLTKERQAEIVADLTGVKRGTGTVVALAYNIMRIVEGAVAAEEEETNVAIEVILDRVANSVFSRKHAGQSLANKCKEAICRADLNALLEMGFPEIGSRRLCEIIRARAGELGIHDLDKHYQAHLTGKKSNVINTIVRKNHRFYFATRSNLLPIALLEHIDRPGNDLCATLLKKTGLLNDSLSTSQEENQV